MKIYNFAIYLLDDILLWSLSQLSTNRSTELFLVTVQNSNIAVAGNLFYCSPPDEQNTLTKHP